MFYLFRELVLIGSLTACGVMVSLLNGLMPPPWQAPQLAAGEIRLEDARVLDIIWVDARSEEAYKNGHIPDSILLNDSNWDIGIQNLMNLWLTEVRPIVVYCSSAGCDLSKKIATRLREALPEAEVYRLNGGWETWEK